MPLSGLRIVELGSLPAASYCARLFADFGAEVIKVEPPEGDPGRWAAPLIDTPAGRESGAFGFLNVNKASVTVDPANDAQVAALGDLVRGADVLVDALDAAGRGAYRIDHAALRTEHPNLIILSMSWFGESGPYQSYRGTDAVCRAIAGLVHLIGPKEGPPVPVPDHQAGPVGGLTAFIAAMASLLSRQTQNGRRFEVSVLDANLALSDYNVALAWAAGAPGPALGRQSFPAQLSSRDLPLQARLDRRDGCHARAVEDILPDARHAGSGSEIRVSPSIADGCATPTKSRRALRRGSSSARRRSGLRWRWNSACRSWSCPTWPICWQATSTAAQYVSSPVTHGGRSYEMPGSPLRLACDPAARRWRGAGAR